MLVLDAVAEHHAAVDLAADAAPRAAHGRSEAPTVRTASAVDSAIQLGLGSSSRRNRAHWALGWG